MDSLDFLSDEEVARVFHCKKTEMSCMEEPHTFLNQLRDHNLVPDKLYKEVMKAKNREKKEAGVYQILDWLEEERGDYIKLFWRCVFQEHILQKYSVLRSLRDSFLNGSISIYNQIPDAEKTSGEETQTKNTPKKRLREKSTEESKEEAGSSRSHKPIPDVQAECSDGKKTPNAMKKGKRKESNKETNEEAGSSLQSTSTPKKQAKISKFYSPVTEQSKNINTWDLSKNQLPVTCGEKRGVLYKDKLTEGTECILSEGRWFTPTAFEFSAGKGSSKNWKVSIRSKNIPLQKLIKDGKLKCIQKRSTKRKKRSPKALARNSSPESIFSEESEKSEDDQVIEIEQKEQDEEDDSADKQLFKAFFLPISCGSVCGSLYKQRFTGPRTKCIRTEERWFSPEELINQDSTLTCGHWKKDILCHGKNLNYLLENKILFAHSQLCECTLCRPENKKEHDNDDVCFICNTGGDLVCCDDCPRAFHPHCHLPALDDGKLGEQWMCTFCVFKTNKKIWCHMTEEEALNQPISNSIMHCEYLLLCLYKGDARRVFTEDPTGNVKNYSRVIAIPMWFNRVRSRLENIEYRTVREFVQDVKLIFTNCKTFNKDNEFGKMGSRLHDIFNSEFSKAFKILQ